MRTFRSRLRHMRARWQSSRDAEFYTKLTRLGAALLIIVVMVGGASLSYWWLHGGEHTYLDCLLMAVTTVATVGYGEIVPLDTPLLKIGTLFLILFGTGSLLYFMSLITSLVIEGDLRRYVEGRSMKRRIDALTHHVIVCGAGDTGREAAADLHRAGTPFVVIDRNASALDRLKKDIHDDILTLHDSALDDDVLHQAGIGRARALISALSEDPDNLYVTVSARSLNPALVIVARCMHETAERKLRHAGATAVVSPQALGGNRMAMCVLQPELTQFFDTVTRDTATGVRIEMLHIRGDSPLAGRPLSTPGLLVEFPQVLVLGIRAPNGAMRYAPDRSAIVEPESELFVFGQSAHLQQVRTSLKID